MSGENDRAGRLTPPDTKSARAAQAAVRPAAGTNPFLEEASAPAPPPVRAKRAKLPPAIITAGGVDAARGHAANISPKSAGEPVRSNESKVVLTVQPDLRHMPTARSFKASDRPPPPPKAATIPTPMMPMPTAAPTPIRAPLTADDRPTPESSRRPGVLVPKAPTVPTVLPEAAAVATPAPPVAAAAATGASPWATPQPALIDKTALSSANIPKAAPAPVVAPAPAPTNSSPWLKVATVVVVILLLLGVVRRLRMERHPESGPVSAPAPTGVFYAPPADETAAATAVPTAPAVAEPTETARVRPVGPGVPGVPNAPQPVDPAGTAPVDPSAEPAVAPTGEAPADPSAAAVAPHLPRLAPPPPKPTFKPLFEMPEEKSKP